ncbi:hypothetical protein D3C79_654740 [compost metagenome]
MLLAQRQQLGGAVEVIGQLHLLGAVARLAHLRRLDDKTATNRIIGLLQQRTRCTAGFQGHGVGVIRQAFIEQQQIGCAVERDRPAAVEHQHLALLQLGDQWLDALRVDLVRPFAHQPEQAGAVGGVADAGGRQ